MRREITGQVLGIFEGWSYREVEVPLLDYFDHLRDVLEPISANSTFRFVDRDGNLRVLRADVTPAIAKIYANQLTHLPLPLRLCYANKIVRIQRAFTSEQIESYQLGVELIGAHGLIPELEVLLICIETLTALGIEDYQIKLGNLAIYQRLLERSSVPTSVYGDITKAVLNRDPFEVRQRLHRIGVRPNISEAIQSLASLSGGVEQLERINAAIQHDDKLTQASQHMEKLLSSLDALNLADKVHLDLGHIHGPMYYTGMTFRVISESIGRELGGGGRYDNLIGAFGAQTPAVGFSLGLDALLEIIAPHAASEVAPTPGLSDAVVVVDPDSPHLNLQEAISRRAAGHVTRLTTPSTPPPPFRLENQT